MLQKCMILMLLVSSAYAAPNGYMRRNQDDTIDMIASRAVVDDVVAAGDIYVGDDLTVTGSVTAADLTLDEDLIFSKTSTTSRIIDATSTTNIYNDVNFSVSALNPGASGAQLKVDSGSNTVKQLSLEMDDGELVYVNVQMPHEWVAGSTVFPHFHWQPQLDNAVTNVWITTYEIADGNQDFSPQVQVTSTNIIAAGNQWQHKLMNVPSGGIDMTGYEGPSTIIRMRFELDSTTDPDIDILGFDVHVRCGGSPVPYNP